MNKTVLANGAPVALELLLLPQLVNQSINPPADVSPVLGDIPSVGSQHQGAVVRIQGTQIRPHVAPRLPRVIKRSDWGDVNSGLMQSRSDPVAAKLRQEGKELLFLDPITNRLRDVEDAVGVEAAISSFPWGEDGKWSTALCSRR